jgi:hypothetical protein
VRAHSLKLTLRHALCLATTLSVCTSQMSSLSNFITTSNRERTQGCKRCRQAPARVGDTGFGG